MGCDIHGNVEVRVNGKWTIARDLDDVHMGGRDYNLFAVLADVRNETWSERIEPISEARGLPDDSPTGTMHYAYETAGYPSNVSGAWVGDHSFSWVTLAELEAYPWSREITYRAYVDNDTWAKYEATGEKPDSYSGGYWAGRGCEPTAFLREWTDVPVNLDRVEQFLTALRALGAPDDVRLVFGFDS